MRDIVDLNHFRPIQLRATTPRRQMLGVIHDLAQKHGFSADDILGRERSKAISLARHEVVWTLKEVHGLSFPHIGRLMNGRDPTTAMNSHRKYDAWRRAQGRVQP